MNVKTIIRWPALVAVVLAALLMGMGLPPAHANQPPGSVASSPEKSEAPISIEAPLVNVDVLVTDQDGRVLSDLKRENFRVLDNGKAQVITHFERASLNYSRFC
jgi:hypothetical protein